MAHKLLEGGFAEHRYQVVVVAGHVEQQNLVAIEAQLAPGDYLKQLFEGACAARERQNLRFHGMPGTYCNAQMTPAMVREFCTMAKDVETYLEDAFHRLNMSGRAHDRVLRVARTVADFEGHDSITVEDIQTALSFREEF